MPLWSTSFRELLVQHQPRLRIERAERLVEQQDVRLHHQRAGDADALAHSAGQLAWILVFETCEIDCGNRPARLFFTLGPRYAAQLETERDVLDHAEPRKQIEGLPDRGHGGPAGDLIGFQKQNTAARRRQEAAHDLEQGALAASARTDDGGDLPRLEPACRVGQRRHGLSGLAGKRQADILEFDRD
jgi:hypothetical protein